MKVTVNIKAKHIELAKGMLMQAADTDEEENQLISGNLCHLWLLERTIHSINVLKLYDNEK